MIFVSPYKTSQRRHRRGKIDSRNRKGERFRRLSCGHEYDADPERGEKSEIRGVNRDPDPALVFFAADETPNFMYHASE